MFFVSSKSISILSVTLWVRLSRLFSYNLPRPFRLQYKLEYDFDEGVKYLNKTVSTPLNSINETLGILTNQISIEKL